MNSPDEMEWLPTDVYLAHGSNGKLKNSNGKRMRNEDPSCDPRIIIQQSEQEQEQVPLTLFDKIGRSIKDAICRFTRYRQLRNRYRRIRGAASDRVEALRVELGAKRQRVEQMPCTWPATPSPRRMQTARITFNRRQSENTIYRNNCWKTPPGGRIPVVSPARHVTMTTPPSPIDTPTVPCVATNMPYQTSTILGSATAPVTPSRPERPRTVTPPSVPFSPIVPPSTNETRKIARRERRLERELGFTHGSPVTPSTVGSGTEIPFSPIVPPSTNETRKIARRERRLERELGFTHGSPVTPSTVGSTSRCPDAEIPVAEVPDVGVPDADIPDSHVTDHRWPWSSPYYSIFSNALPLSPSPLPPNATSSMNMLSVDDPELDILASVVPDGWAQARETEVPGMKSNPVSLRRLQSLSEFPSIRRMLWGLPTGDTSLEDSLDIATEDGSREGSIDGATEDESQKVSVDGGTEDESQEGSVDGVTENVAAGTGESTEIDGTADIGHEGTELTCAMQEQGSEIAFDIGQTNVTANNEDEDYAVTAGMQERRSEAASDLGQADTAIGAAETSFDHAQRGHAEVVFSEELSFLEDAPPTRRVHFLHSPWFGDYPMPSEVREYARGERIGYPTLYSNFRRMQRRAAASPAQSMASTPGTARKTPGRYDLSPSEKMEKTSTPQGMNDMRNQFDLFKISKSRSASRREREEKERVLAARKAAEAGEEKRKEEKRIAEEERKRELAKGSIVTNLTPDWDAKVSKAMSMKTLTSTITPAGLTRKDFGTVLPQNATDGDRFTAGWLNDEIVNGYLDAISKASLEKTGYVKTADAVPPCHAFSTHMYTTWKNKGGFSAVQKWWSRPKLNGLRLLNVDTVLIPINTGVHWVLIVISGTRKTIEFYDSLSGNPKEYTQFALDLVAGNLGKAFKKAEWTIVNAQSVQQNNSKDCGVFVCMNSLALIKGRVAGRAFSADDMPAARRMVAGTLLNGGFGGGCFDV